MNVNKEILKRTENSNCFNIIQFKTPNLIALFHFSFMFLYNIEQCQF